MPTHKQGPHKKNLSVNLHELAKAAVGRLAFVRDMGSSELVRDLIRRELEIAAVRGEIVREVALEAIEALKKPCSDVLLLVGILSLIGVIISIIGFFGLSAAGVSMFSILGIWMLVMAVFYTWVSYILLLDKDVASHFNPTSGF